MLIPARAGELPVARHDSTPRRLNVPATVWLLAGVTVVGAVLRFALLTTQSYWFDEAQAAHEFQLSFGAMLSTVSHYEPNPPLFFVVGWLWAKVFGTGEAGLRSLSALLGTAVIPVTYLCGRDLVSRRAGLVAAGLAALCPFMIWYSQEAREYMLLALLCGLSFLYLIRTLDQPSRRNLVLWAVFSGLALLTQYFAGFLVAAELLILIYRLRSRAVLIAAAAMVAVEATLVPHLISHAAHPRGWIGTFALAVRIQQVPVALGLGNLYLSPIISYGLLGAAALVGCLLALLIIGADRHELRGAALAAAVAVFVLLAPLALALAGHDYYEARALMPAWIPLAVVVGAACTASGARIAGAALAVVLLAAFVYAGIRVSDHPQYQRSDLRGVAAALGTPSGPRAIVAYDGTYATAPLALYLPGVAWTGKGQTPQPSQPAVTVREVDVIGSPFQNPASPLPPGARLIGSAKMVGTYKVERFLLAKPWVLPRSSSGARATLLLGPAASGADVLVQARGTT